MTNFYTLDEEIKKRKHELGVLVQRQEEIQQEELNKELRSRLEDVDKLELAKLLSIMTSSYRMMIESNRHMPNNEEYDRSVVIINKIFGEK